MRFSFTNTADNDNLSLCLDDNSDVLTIEGLRRQYNSCSDCGVYWHDDHVSLDCIQCGGYAMCRPCPKCNGKCGAVWRRDVRTSHINNKAEWVGSCSLEFQWKSEILDSKKFAEDKNANYHHHHHISPKNKTFIQKSHVL